MKPFALFTLVALTTGATARQGCTWEDPSVCHWTQHGHDFAHSGHTCDPGQPPTHKLAHFTFDPFVADEVAATGGDLFTHYQAPLVMDDDLYMLVKTGRYVSCEPKGGPHPCGLAAWDSQVWNEARFVWKEGRLTEAWRFKSDWKPEPWALAEWEPVFHPALHHDVLYVPGAGGTVHKLNRESGEEMARLNPFGEKIDPTIYVAGGLAVGPDGTLYYNAIKLDPSNPLHDATGWLVRISPDGEAKTVTYQTLVPGAPKPTDLCSTTAISARKPKAGQSWSGGSAPFLPTSGPCYSQRAGLNLTPAIDRDGTVYTASRAHGARAYAYLVAVKPDLTPKWATSLRGLLAKDEWSADPTLGVAPAGAILDSSTSSPVLLPDGTLLFGAITGVGADRGHLFHFSADGQPLNNFDYGWDITPAWYAHDGTYSIILKDNHYDSQRYLITSLSPKLEIEWSLQSTNTKTCHEGKDGKLTCVDDHPNGFEWCVNAPAVDAEGTVYVNSEDGFLYTIGRDGKEKGHIFLNKAVGAAYTPVALDAKGRIYAINGGVLTVLGE